MTVGVQVVDDNNVDVTAQANGEREKFMSSTEEDRTKGVDFEADDDEDKSPPHDRLNIVLLCIFLHGIAVLMPWNMFITIDNYFVNYKFNGTSTDYGKNYLSYVGISSQLPNLLLSALNLFVQVRGSVKYRVLVCLGINIIICLFTVGGAVVDSSDWTKTFFWLTMLSVVILNGSNGVYQNSIFGLAADFPFQYTNAVVVGNNFCGLFVSVVSILATVLSPGAQLTAIVYFSVSTCVLVAAVVSYYLLTKQPFYKHYHQMGVLSRDKSIARELSVLNHGPVDGFMSKLKPYALVAKEIYVHLFNVFFVFFVTLTIFPAMQANIQSIDPEASVIPGYLFTSITTFLNFNLFSMLGSYTANHVQIPGPRLLWLPVLLRGLLVPFFLFCNYRPEFRTWPVLFANDWLFMLMGAFMGLSNGYLSSLAMMYCPRVVSGDKARLAGMMAAFFLVLGICCGVNFTLVISWVNESLGPDAPGTWDPTRNVTGLN